MTRDKIRPILPVPGPKPPWSLTATLRITATALRRVADITKNAKDIAAADEAEKLFAAREASTKLAEKK